ncbi:hypothetical protein Raf01_12890 [Rugosimonospora africana]|uniref:Uncharacterized protein n=1 Tax=Rugosimonospora africana TaxID=556532 RepID=A0A8J3QP28_9ACTN|nr:hypothetical protein Raf01_12890 [Rugosimonospora africana]
MIRQPVGDVGLDQAESGIVGQMGHILLGTGDEIVQRHHLAAPSDQGVYEMGADEPGAARYQYPVTLAVSLHNRHTAQVNGSVAGRPRRLQGMPDRRPDGARPTGQAPSGPGFAARYGDYTEPAPVSERTSSSA